MQHITDRRVEPLATRATAGSLRAATTVDLAVAGMGCPNCANRIRNALLSHRGVLEAEMDVPSALARVWYDPSCVGVGEIVAMVATVGAGTHHLYLAVPLVT